MGTLPYRLALQEPNTGPYEKPFHGHSFQSRGVREGFRKRLQTAVHEKRDEAMEKIRETYGKRAETLENRIFAAEQRLEKEKEQQKHQKVRTGISLGATVLEALFGGARSAVGRAATLARSASRAAREKQDVEQASEKLEKLREDLKVLSGKLEAELEEIAKSLDPVSEELQSVSVKLLKKNITVKRMLPVWASSPPAP